jgi:hypothetical protein
MRKYHYNNMGDQMGTELKTKRSIDNSGVSISQQRTRA